MNHRIIIYTVRIIWLKNYILFLPQYRVNLIEIQNINLFGSVYLSLSIKISTSDIVCEKIYENNLL